MALPCIARPIICPLLITSPQTRDESCKRNFSFSFRCARTRNNEGKRGKRMMKKRAEERRRSSRTEEDTVANKQREVKCRQIEWSEIHLFDSMNAVSCSVFFRLGSQQVRLNTLANGIAPFPLLWMAPATTPASRIHLYGR